jgi:hypothetical protein
MALSAAALPTPSLVLGTHVIHTSPLNLTCAAQPTIVLRRFFCRGWRLGDGLASAPPIRIDLDRPSRQLAIVASI